MDVDGNYEKSERKEKVRMANEGEKKIICRHCKKKFQAKIGNKNNKHNEPNRVMRCPHCGVSNTFKI